ncbi:shikimate dehydrogenase family protein [Propionicicella superfundia]|uniref:shikimate dehydrogenase family protein n=1 Tax=Propionicicella superfundia TaxID=348582 RepID=UPI00040772E1|nr:hypothetical protein [Propionicicella superfundia]
MPIPDVADGADRSTGPAPGQHRVAVLGYPAAHSLSPVIHRRGYELCGLEDWRYDVVELRPAEVEGFLRSRDASWRGFSVTMPLKETVAALGVPDPLVERMHVANTLVIEPHPGGPVRRVYNTDVGGLVDAVTGTGLPAPRSAVVIGSGATALSAVVALGSLGARVVVAARDERKAALLAARGDDLGVATDTTVWGTFPSCDTVVSTVPSAGVGPHVRAVLDAGPRLVFDVIYDPWPTPLATAAAQAGAAVLSGLDLLVHQATAQFRLFTGRSVPAAPLLLAVRAEAARRTAT